MAILTIENFLGIKFAQVEFAPFTVLIGPQASGKSITAKLMYFFETAKHDFQKLETLNENLHSFRNKIRVKFDAFFPKYAIKNKNYKIYYHSKNFSITIDPQKKYFIIFNDETKKEFNRLKKQYKKFFSNEANKKIENINNSNDNIKKDLNEETRKYMIWKVSQYLPQLISSKNNKNFIIDSLDDDTKPLYIPATRSLLSILEENVFTIFNQLKTDIALEEFGKEYEKLKQAYLIVKESKSNDIKEALKLAKHLLKGEYGRDKDIEYISQKSQKIELIHTSSGQQSLTPLLIGILKPLIDPNLVNSCYFIEEPEAHLFPKSQYDIIKLISMIRNISSEKPKYFITTHSPYIVSSINNLTIAGNIFQKNLTEKTIKHFKQLQISSQDVKAYSIENGYINEIMDHENLIINADAIDEASEIIGKDFSEMMEVLYAS